MNSRQTELSYRRAVVQNASSAGLIIILYDLLIDDLRQAISAIEKRDIEARSKAIKHCFLVLQQLEGSLDKENGAEAAKYLAKVYATMRCRIFEAHMKVSPEILNQQVLHLLDLRRVWQELDPSNPAPEAGAAAKSAMSTGAANESENASWTA
jgi:flagellar biosynthetic protein FliS